MKTRHFLLACVAGLTATVLAACSGSPGSDPAPVDDGQGNLPPASASATTQGLVAYTASLAASANDDGQPVNLSLYALPPDPSDTAVPVATPNDGPGPGP
jgi:hypothetical protein